MRKTLIAVVSLTAFLITAGMFSPASAQVPSKSGSEKKAAKSETLKQTGTITSVDAEAKTFICKWQTNLWPYKVTEKTAFRLKGKPADFADLKLDSRVSMTFHMEGKQRVADIVTIEQ